MNRKLATLVLHHGCTGMMAQIAVHLLAYANGRQCGQRCRAGIQRACQAGCLDLSKSLLAAKNHLFPKAAKPCLTRRLVP